MLESDDVEKVGQLMHLKTHPTKGTNCILCIDQNYSDSHRFFHQLSNLNTYKKN